MNGLTLLGFPLLVFSLGMVVTANEARIPLLLYFFAFFAAVGCLMVLDDLAFNEWLLRKLLDVRDDELNKELEHQQG